MEQISTFTYLGCKIS